MKKVEFTRVVMPIQPGERRVVTDKQAAMLVADDKARVVPSVFDDPSEPAEPQRKPHTAKHQTR